MHGGITKLFSVVGLLTVLTLFGCDIFPSGHDQTETPPSLLPTAKVSLSPMSDTVSPGTTFSRSVEVQNLGNTFYAGFDLTYDPGVIEYLDATEGAFLNKNGSDSTSFQKALQNGAQGRITVGLTRLGQIGEVSGSGTLLTLSFKAIGPGSTTLAFENPKGFKNSSNQDVTISTWENGAVTVQ